ncbi:MAG: thiamine diphosphokinase [Lachnospiraceae bacterium]|nr:thiamine diphosphokinase [Lachnospiraceae bacterium]
MRAFIISGGDIDYDFALSYIEKHPADVVIAVDKGMQFCYARQVRPDYILGDYDSIDLKVLDYYRNETDIDMETFQSEKDDTDTEIALKKAMELGYDDIVILGAMGGRMDHFIANLHLLMLALEHGVYAALVDARNHIRLIREEYSIKKEEQFGHYVSFLPFTDRVEGITLSGFKYPLQDYTMTKGLSIGVSNEIAAPEARVTFTSGVLMMIQSRDETD